MPLETERGNCRASGQKELLSVILSCVAGRTVNHLLRRERTEKEKTGFGEGNELVLCMLSTTEICLASKGIRQFLKARVESCHWTQG